MIPWVKSKAKLACLGLCLALAQTSVAGSAANEHVTVTCEAPRIPVEVNGTQFNVFAPGYPDSFVTNVMVVANGNWKLEKPTRAELPLKMRGGDTAAYKVTREPEDEAGGTIAFHNYCIKSNIDGGAKDIVVKTGTSVIYTAYKNGRQCPSDWTVDGLNQTATTNAIPSVVFNRHWWDVPAWFIPSMDTPKPGVYGIHAHDTDHEILEDSGNMTVCAGRFTIYAKSPENGEIFGFSVKLGKLNFDVGHTSWKLEVIPVSTASYVQELCKDTPLKAKHLNTCVGYWPSESLMENETPLGELRIDAPEGASKSYDITIDQLIAGLERTYMIEQNPGTYILGTRVYVRNTTANTSFRDQSFLSDWNCTSVALDVGATMGLSMPAANATWSTNSLIVADRELEVVYEGNSPWKLHNSITQEN